MSSPLLVAERPQCTQTLRTGQQLRIGMVRKHHAPREMNVTIV